MPPRFLKFFFITSLLILGGLLLNYTIVYATLTLDSTSLSSDGALTLKSASSSATTLGDPNQSGTITIASSTQTLTLNLGVGSGAATVNIATGTSTAKTINIGTGTSILNVINFGSASSSVNLPGSLGLGITSPSSTLHVSGTLRFIDGNQGAGKGLFSDASGNATWQTPSSTGVRAFHSADQAVSGDFAWNTLSFNSERFDTDSIHSTSTNTSRLTAITAGKYLIIGNIQFQASSTAGVKGSRILLNGTTTIAENQAVPGSASNNEILNLATIYDLATNDYVELQAAQNIGSNLNVQTAGNYSPEFMMHRLGQ